MGTVLRKQRGSAVDGKMEGPWLQLLGVSPSYKRDARCHQKPAILSAVLSAGPERTAAGISDAARVAALSQQEARILAGVEEQEAETSAPVSWTA